MKASRLLWLLTMIMCGAVGNLFAQGCRLDYTPNYDTYYTLSTDGTNVYTTVLMDGSTTGNGGAGCTKTATHTPKAYNEIGSIGGWSTGNGGYMTSYLSVQNDQEDPGTGDGTYTFAYEGQVVCSEFGIFYDISGTIKGQKMTLQSNDCSATPKSGIMHAGWGSNGLSGCLLSADVPYNVPLTTGGSCQVNKDVFEVYVFQGGGKINYAYPVSTRIAAQDCSKFVDGVTDGVITTAIIP